MRLLLINPPPLHRFEHLSRNQLELLQLLGYLSVFVLNQRFLDLLRFIWRFRREGLAMLKKLFGLTLARHRR